MTARVRSVLDRRVCLGIVVEGSKGSLEVQMALGVRKFAAEVVDIVAGANGEGYRIAVDSDSLHIEDHQAVLQIHLDQVVVRTGHSCLVGIQVLRIGYNSLAEADHLRKDIAGRRVGLVHLTVVVGLPEVEAASEFDQEQS